MLAERWHRALLGVETTVIANADDPLVAFAARDAVRVCWVAAGLAWREDATGCPVCGSQIVFDEERWRCEGCGFARPEPTWHLDGTTARGPEGCAVLELALPGRFNLDNALVALAAASAMGIDLGGGASALGEVRDVAGRFVTTTFAGSEVRMMLAKNPAGWSALLELVGGSGAPVVVAINARVADGFDPSWLWDVPFGSLAGRRVVATGDRWRDLSVRLRYAGVEHQTAEDRREAVRLAAAGEGGGVVDVIGNYTAFGEMLRAR
jgi:UDP-N-acetylmuramyl tripeptide synthase